jgi:hypothetical protein
MLARQEPNQAEQLHRDQTSVDACKNVSSFEIIMLAVYGPTLGFVTKQRNSFLIKFGMFYNKNKILIILFTVKYEKITL